jgi:hypothetical protein
MIQQFVNRKSELGFLKEKYSEKSSQLIIIYGRRRIGKTELIKRFLMVKRGCYILCTRDSLLENLKEMKRKFFELTGKEYFLKVDVDSFFDLFRYLADEIGNEKAIIVVDEFPYLIELQKGIVSVFQKAWDELLKDKKVFLVLCGSSVGMMETEVLSYKSPLYGRRTGEWKVGPLKFGDLKALFKHFSLEDLVKIWCICGGTPFYLVQMDPSLSVEENIKTKILRKGEVLYSEPKVLLREEFREPKTYSLILKYLSLGYNTQGELSSVTGIEKGNLSKYLSVLEETGLVRYVLPLGRRKRGIYTIVDPFFNFWFRFVNPNLSDLEIGMIDEVSSKIFAQLNSYFGQMFEQLVTELVRTKEILLPLSFTEVRKWWHKDREVDLIALNDRTGEILFAECKWQDGVDAEKVLHELKEKADFVGWRKKGQKEYYAIFAKSFRKKIEEVNVLLFDLNDLGKVWQTR